MVNLITEHLDIWSAAQGQKSNGGRGRGNGSNGQSTYGIKKLRELILELAVRGKLLPQDPNDEPASKLLNNILKEKTRLIKEKKIKKQKSLPEIKEEEKPFKLPEGWKWERLGNLTNYGISDKVEPSDVNDNTWVLELEDVEKETSKILQKIRFSDKQFLSTKNRFSKGDVIYGKLRPYLDKVIVADEDGVCTTEMIPIKSYKHISPWFLRLVLKAPYFIRYANESTHGMNLPRLGADKARLALIPLVAETEQHRIVAKVNELMILCDKLEQQQTDTIDTHQILVETLLTALSNSSNQKEFSESWQRIANHFDTLFTTEQSIDQLKQTILQLAVMGKLVPQDPNDEPASELLKKITREKAQLIKEGKIKKQKPLPEIGDDEKPFQLPNGWKWVHFNQLINQEYPISYGVLVPGPDVQNGVPFVRIGDLDLINPPTLPEKSIDAEIDKNYERTRLQGGEILMGVVGSIGKLGVAPKSWRGANIARAICRIYPVELISKRYLIWLLQSDFMQSAFLGDTRTLAQPTLNINLIRSAPVPLPPFSEQNRIVAKIDELMTICDRIKDCIRKTQTIQIQLADAIVEQALVS